MKKEKKLALGFTTAVMGCFMLAGVSAMNIQAVASEDEISAESLLIAGDNVTLTTAQEYNYIGGALKSSAMLATSSGATGSVTTKLIDLSTLTKDDYIFRWRPYSPAKDTQAITMATVKLIDAEDSSNYIQLNYTPNTNMTYLGNSLGAVSQWFYKNTAGEYVATGGMYEYGALMGSVNEIAFQMGNYGGFGGVDITGDGVPEDWIGYGTGHVVQFSLAYENGMLYTPRKGWNTNGDFQSWAGFSSPMVYAELTWTNTIVGNGVAIDSVAGIATTGATVEKDTPKFGSVEKFTALLNTEMDVPVINAYSYTHEVSSTVSLYFKDGETWVDKSALIVDGKFTPNVAGEWKFVYTTTDGSNITKEVPFETEGFTKVSTENLLVAGENVTFTPAQEYNYIGGALKSNAMLATSSGETGMVTTKLIDLSTLTKDDYIFRWRPYSPAKDTQAVTMTTIKLIDAEDSTNYIQIYFTPNTNMLYKGNSMGAVSQFIYKNTSGEYVATGGVYEYGALMGTVNELAYELGNFGGFGGVDITGDGVPEDWIGYGTNHIVQFYLSYENGMLYTPRKEWNTNGDFQSWAGFSSSMVYAEMTWTNLNTGNGLAIDTIVGYDATGETVQKDIPVFGAAKAMTAVVDTEMEVPVANIYCYTHSVETAVELYYEENGNWINKTSLIVDGKFTPDAIGDWKFIYTTMDGSELSNEVPFTVALKEVEGYVSNYETAYFVGEAWSMNPFVSSNMTEEEYSVAYTLTKDGNAVALFDSDTVVFSAEDIGQYELTYTITSLRGATLSITKSFEVYEYPTLAATYTLEEGQSVGEIDFGIWNEGWTLSVSLYAAADVDKANVLPITNLAIGEYVLDVMLIIDGRLNAVEISTTLVVEEKPEPIIPENPGDSEDDDSTSSGDSELPNTSEEPDNSSDADSNTTSESNEPSKDKGGCSGSVAGLGVGMAMIAIACFTVIKKKDE